MTLPETQRHADEFVERNAWLHLLLGLESFGRRFDALLERAPVSGPPVEAAAGDAVVVDFVLGLASLRRALGSHLADAHGDGADGGSTTRPGSPEPGLLR